MLVAAIRTASSARDGSFGLRAFADFSLDYRLSDALASTEPGPDAADAVAWLTGFRPQGASAAINRLARWNLSLFDWYSDRIGDLERIAGWDPFGGFDTYAFVSSPEGWTPFGIHLDREPSLIYHLGPGRKEVWIWPAGEPSSETFESTVARNGYSFDFETHLPAADTFTLEPGDFLCIPAGFYHVFRNVEASAFLGLTPFPSNLGRFRNEAVAQESARGIDDHFARRVAVTEMDLLRRATSRRHMTAPAPAVLPAGDVPHSVTERFVGVLQPRPEGGIYAFGRVLRAARDAAGDARICDHLAGNRRVDAGSLAAAADCSVERAHAVIGMLYRTGSVVASK